MQKYNLEKLAELKPHFLKMWQREIKMNPKNFIDLADQFVYYYVIFKKAENGENLTEKEKFDLIDTLLDSPECEKILLNKTPENVL